MRQLLTINACRPIEVAFRHYSRTSRNSRFLSTQLPKRPSSIAAKDMRPYKEERLRELAASHTAAYPSYRGQHVGVDNLPWWPVQRVAEQWSTLLVAGERLREHTIRVTGRVVSVREASSKLFFFDIVHNNEQLQIVASLRNFTSKTTSNEENILKFRQENRRIHRGDIIEIIGFPGKTDKGELSVFATALPSLLAPCLHDLPIHDRLSSAEKRFRNRHVDLLVNPDAVRTLRTRSKIIQFVRQFLDRRNFLEVETPILSLQAGGASARPFTTHSQALGDQSLYLRIAPELYLKQLVIGGLDSVYEIGKQFRNEGIDADHNPEFTMCEFYCAYADLHDLMHITETMLSSMADTITGSTLIALPPGMAKVKSSVISVDHPDTISFEPPFARINVTQALLKEIGPLPDLNSPEALDTLLAICRKRRITIPTPHTLPRVLDRLIGEYVEPLCQQPTFLYGHPIIMSPLAKTKIIDCEMVSARFELFVAGREIVNAYEELNDPEEQRDRFSRQQQERDQGDKEAPLPDNAYCDALEYGLPPTGGWGMGIDRVCALFSQVHHLRETLAFPLMKSR
ncbi:lysyl-tRNA synthetase-like protein [Syncephalis fuscata]|nr:lysyl-tRNA synthetase-like protein [Syncephalis fuscata]